MSRNRLTVVLSQGQGKNPTKRGLEESIIAALIMEPGLDVSVVPYLYDLDPQHTGRLFLESIQGDMVLLSWLFPRAAYWVLDRDGIKGKFGESQLKPAQPDDEEPDNEDEETGDEQAPPAKGIGALAVPDRWIYCLDLRDFGNHEPYVNEVRRIAQECKLRQETNLKQWIKGEPTLVQLGRYLQPETPPAPVPTSPPSTGSALTGLASAVQAMSQSPTNFSPDQLLKQPERRWYPVIDYSRCTNCMECLDFCLFGVYGVDNLDRILVESQDNCKRGCPACSRVCPEQAIMFPDYKTPAIAGAPVGSVSGLKIDLSRLFGGGDAIAIAAQERDRELVADGRDAVGLTVGVPKRQAQAIAGPKDELDKLMDALDSLEI